MIPTPARIRATRQWALFEACAGAIFCGLVGWAVYAAVGSGLILGYIAVAMLALGLAIAIYRWETSAIRRRIKRANQPFPKSWSTILREHIPYVAALSEEERTRFHALVAIFLDEKPVIGIGCHVDDTCRLLVAASAIIPIFAFPAWEYSTLRKILIRPEPFDADFRGHPDSPRMALGMVGASGFFDGVMILSKPELYAGFAEGAGKHHVGIHEFAHLIDQNDGAIDGVPASLPRECLRPWTTLVHEHLSQHTERDAGIPAYGYTNEAEFFAVVSEYFFQSPDELAKRDPELSALLERIFRQHRPGHRAPSTKTRKH
jgi:MtfA peptidase